MDICDFSLDLFSLAGRNALVTGGNTGLGEDDGSTRRLIEKAGRRMEFEVADITQAGVPAAVVRRCVETLGSVDILVNSAGIALLSDVEEFGRDQWDLMVSVNLTAAFELAYEAGKYMTGQRSGKIINIASLFSFLGGQRSPAYAATKAGIVGFTKAYCDELATHNIQVNAIETGDEQLKAASVDRFRKYTSVHGIYDGPIPAAIVYPSSTADVAAILRFAEENLVNVVSRTGRTATEGGLETVVEDSLVVDGSRMNAILSIDPVDMMATTQCGVGLQELEDTLRAQGLTTGHSPQSKPLAQMGGLVATRSIGQFSTLYGGIEDMVVGLESVFPGGQVTRIKNVPRRAAGPDIRHIVIGSEGALCFVTEVTVKLFRYQPENNRYFGFQ